jgi:single-strand DNA-binding protein
MNQTIIIGNIGSDAVIAQHGENSVINFTLAQTETYLDHNQIKVEKTRWYDCALWRQKTKIAEYLKKGQLVCVTGSVELRTWQSQGGEFKAGFSMRVENVELLGGKKE